jgi:uncharacterized protein (TIGR03067 family)
MRSLLVLLLAVPLVAAPVPKALKKKAPALDGTWKIVEWYSGDTRMQLTDEVIWTVDGENLAVEGKVKGAPDGFVPNATRTMRKPDDGPDNALDYTITPTDGSRQSFRPAVYELDGDTFKICLTDSHNGPRPTECKPDGRTVMYVLKRVEK